MTVFELLNELHKENSITKSKEERSGREVKFHEKFSVMETKDERYINNSHEYMIKDYKTKELTDPEDLLQKKECYSDPSEKRRKIKKDVNGYYNYIPEICTEHVNIIVSDVDGCRKAHNDNEVNYHSLVYKTNYCKKRCNDGMCYKAHNLEDDFRRIYDYGRKDVVELTIKLEDSELFKHNLVNYMSYFMMPDDFSLDSYKVNPCKLVGFCTVDPHLCLNYHDIKERRRPPKLFRLTNEICEFAKPDKNSDFFPQLCRSVNYS